jgi:hypothetical protein
MQKPSPYIRMTSKSLSGLKQRIVNHPLFIVKGVNSLQGDENSSNPFNFRMNNHLDEWTLSLNIRPIEQTFGSNSFASWDYFMLKATN